MMICPMMCRTALGCHGDPEEVAHVMLGPWLPAAPFPIGAAIPVDGGLMSHSA
jgi:hypothetical protein